MKLLRASLLITALLQFQTAVAEEMQCKAGPLTIEVEGYDWLAYSCSDERTLVFFSAEGNPAMPYYFMLIPEGANYRLLGEGTGDRSVTSLAAEVFGQFTLQEINELIEATQNGAF
jgi:hypothetical protein